MRILKFLPIGGRPKLMLTDFRQIARLEELEENA